ncbi:MAG: hypothetical protein ACTSQE_01330 [Candidatus Heimdallarchaeaceae archaeon]
MVKALIAYHIKKFHLANIGVIYLRMKEKAINNRIYAAKKILELRNVSSVKKIAEIVENQYAVNKSFVERILYIEEIELI